MAWLVIIGAIIATILSIAGIVALYSLLEMLKLVALTFVLPFTFLWLWTFWKKTFDLDMYVSAVLSAVITIALGYAVYNSWWAIITLSIVVLILYILWKIIYNLGIKDILEIIGGVKWGKKR
jgi:hypothetical protein